MEQPPRYSQDGITLWHPEDWTLTREARPGERVVSITSPSTCFWSLMVFLDRPDANDVLTTAIESFESEYDQLDVYPVKAKVCGQVALARDVEFFCYDLTNTAQIRVIQTDRLTVLVLCQSSDEEWDEFEPLLKQITASLDLDETVLAADSFRLHDEDDLLPDGLDEDAAIEDIEPGDG
jgi:hypothetical protein